MLASYGYQDGAGEFFITVDTDKCTGCALCVPACRAGVLEMVDDAFDIDAEKRLAAVSGRHVRKLRYACAPCKPARGRTPEELPCIRVCEPGALQHSW